MRLSAIAVLLVLSLAGLPDATAQDETITNAVQFATFLDQPGLSYPLINVAEPAMFIPTYNMLWVDFDHLPDAIGEVRKYDGRVEYGVATWPLRLIRSATGTRITYRGVTDLLELPAAANDNFSARYAESLRSWCILTGKNYTSHKDLIEQGYTFLDPPILVVDLYVADINDLPTYEANCAAEQATAEEARAQITSASRSMQMFSEESEGFGMEAAIYQTNFCGGVPVTAISQTTTNIRLNWISITNDTYAVQYADNMEWFNTWHLIGDNVTSASSNAVWEDVGVLSTNVTKRFYRVVRKDASYGLPCVTILTPTNGATLSGTAGIGVYATDDSRISILTLMVDGNDITTVTDGPMGFQLPTTFFTNGVHSLAVRAADNAGILNLGGDPNSPVVVNTTTSETVQVTFQNDITVSWFEGFQSSLPIQAHLAFSNADWTVTVKSESGTTVKDFSGTTSNAQISITWDGTDNSSSSVPYDAVYFVTVEASQGSGFSASSVSSATFASYREQFVGTAQTLLVRQKFSRTDVQAASIGRLENIKDWIALAEYNADVYLGAVQQMAVNSDWDDLLYYLKDPPPRDITQFYYYGHAGPLALGYRETTPDKGITQGDVAIVTSNFLIWAAVPVPHYRTPYKFVFIDGCEAAQGDWSEAFGIKKAQVNYALVGRKNRAFMGWQHIVIADFLFSVHYGSFTTGFWQYWTEDVSRTLADSIDLAFADEPLVALSELKVYGNNGLTWGE